MSFALYLDEDVNPLLADMLRHLGHDVVTTPEARTQGNTDPEQLRFASREGRAILTHDRQDYEVIYREWLASGTSHSGIVVCHKRTPAELRAWALQMFDLYPEGIANLFITLPLAR